jgi:hypothetical protein
MPSIEVDGCRLMWRSRDPPMRRRRCRRTRSAPTSPCGTAKVKPFTQHFRLVRYDRRGHGKSAVPPGPYTMGRLGRDVLGILDYLGIDKTDWCGLSKWFNPGSTVTLVREKRQPRRGVHRYAGTRGGVETLTRHIDPRR